MTNNYAKLNSLFEYVSYNSLTYSKVYSFYGYTLEAYSTSSISSSADYTISLDYYFNFNITLYSFKSPCITP